MSGELRERAIENAMIRLGEHEAPATICETVDATLAVLPPALTAAELDMIQELIHGTQMWIQACGNDESTPYVQRFRQAIAAGNALAAGLKAEPGS
jgi:hypothetical protein